MERKKFDIMDTPIFLGRGVFGWLNLLFAILNLVVIFIYPLSYALIFNGFAAGLCFEYFLYEGLLIKQSSLIDRIFDLSVEIFEKYKEALDLLKMKGGIKKKNLLSLKNFWRMKMTKNKDHLIKELEDLKITAQANNLLMQLAILEKDKKYFKNNIEQACRSACLILNEIDNGGQKPNRRICSLNENIDSCIKTKCCECGIICYYDKNTDIALAKKCKNICPKCALKNEDLSDLQREILKSSINNFK